MSNVNLYVPVSELMSSLVSIRFVHEFVEFPSIFILWSLLLDQLLVTEIVSEFPTKPLVDLL